MKERLLKIFNIASFLILFLAVVTAVTYLIPGEAITAWDGTVASSYQSGDGTSINPYIIATEEQLAKFIVGLNSNVTYAGKYFALSGDLDMTGGDTWDATQITFAGHFDGHGYTITARCSFLEVIDEGGTVQGLNYVCTEVENKSIFCDTNNGTIQNCFVKGDAEGGSVVGLLCGANNGVISNCGAIGNVYAYGSDCSSYAGMIAQNNYSGTVSNCYAAVSAVADYSGKYNTKQAGPVVGNSQSVATVTNCVYDNNIFTNTDNYSTGISTADFKGGVAISCVNGLVTPQCGWIMDSAFDGYPHLFHLPHTYTAFVANHKDQNMVVYNGTSMKVELNNLDNEGSIYYTTDSTVNDPTQFVKYTGGFNIFGDTTITMAVKYDGQFGAVTRQRFIGLPGSGTLTSPYKISEKYQLWLPEVFPSAHFVLTNDLIFTDEDYTSGSNYSGGWTPINSFSGNFNGQGFAIYGLKGSKGGLFENNSGIIQNLRIIDHRLTGPGALGAVVDTNNGGTVSRCYTKSAFDHNNLISFDSNNQVSIVGGVVGYNNGTVEYCRNDGIVYTTTTKSNSKPHIGGIVGEGGDIHHCVNTGDLVFGDYEYSWADYVFMGGIAGLGNVTNCKAIQDMYLNESTDYNPYVAGISAWYSTGFSDNCIAGYTLYKNATFGAEVRQYAYSAYSSKNCYDAEFSRLPSDCEGLVFGYGGDWWVSNDGPVPQGAIDADGHAWVLKSDGQNMPTCTTDGDAWLECTICGMGSNSVGVLENIQKLGHKYEADECTRCDEVKIAINSIHIDLRDFEAGKDILLTTMSVDTVGLMNSVSGYGISHTFYSDNDGCLGDILESGTFEIGTSYWFAPIIVAEDGYTLSSITADDIYIDGYAVEDVSVYYDVNSGKLVAYLKVRTTYVINFMVDDSSVLIVNVNNSEKITPPADPIQNGKNFLGWYTDSGTKFDFAISITTDINLFAKFEDVVEMPKEKITIDGAALRITEDISVIYYVTVPKGYIDPYMVFEFNGREYTIIEHTVQDDGYLRFVFQGVVPQCMGDNIRATLYATFNDIRYSNTVEKYSVRMYCEKQLNNNPSDKLRALLSDLLCYGEKCQLYTKYKKNSLVTSGLMLCPSTFIKLDSCYNQQTLTGIIDTDIGWSGASLFLANNMCMRISVTTANPEYYTYEITINGRTTVYTADDLQSNGINKYYLEFRGIMATEFNHVINAVIKKNGTPVGQELRYSVNTYIYKKQEDATILGDILRAAYNYGVSAANYAE